MKFCLKWFRVVELWVQCRFTDKGPLETSNLSCYGFFINPPSKKESLNIPRVPWGSPKFKSAFPGHSSVWGDHQWNNLVKFSLISVFHFGDSQSTDKPVQSTLISIYKKALMNTFLFFLPSLWLTITVILEVPCLSAQDCLSVCDKTLHCGRFLINKRLSHCFHSLVSPTNYKCNKKNCTSVLKQDYGINPLWHFLQLNSCCHCNILLCSTLSKKVQSGTEPSDLVE